jgi:dolichol-phosphate mannosyltransferase
VVILGAAVIALSLGRLGWLAASPMHPDAAVQAVRTATGVLALIGGLVILAIGTVGVYLTKTFVEAMKRPLYFVETRRGLPS